MPSKERIIDFEKYSTRKTDKKWKCHWQENFLIILILKTEAVCYSETMSSTDKAARLYG